MVRQVGQENSMVGDRIGMRIAIEMPTLFNLFDWKCRDDGELPLKHDDFRLKNG